MKSFTISAAFMFVLSSALPSEPNVWGASIGFELQFGYPWTAKESESVKLELFSQKFLKLVDVKILDGLEVTFEGIGNDEQGGIVSIGIFVSAEEERKKNRAIDMIEAYVLGRAVGFTADYCLANIQAWETQQASKDKVRYQIHSHYPYVSIDSLKERSDWITSGTDEFKEFVVNNGRAAMSYFIIRFAKTGELKYVLEKLQSRGEDRKRRK